MIRKLLAGLALAAVAGAANATDINFDDGTAGNPVGSFYSGLGVTFSNTIWIDNFGLDGSSGPLGIGDATGNQFIFGPDTPLIATFSTAQSHVKITGIDVGEAGIQLDAYDSGNNLIGSSSAFGPDIGVGSFFDIFVDIGGIASVHIFQPGSLGDQNSLGEGIVVDNFSFSGGAPEPATWALMIGGFGLAGAALRRRAAATAA